MVTKRDRYAKESEYIDEYLDKIGVENALYVDVGCGNVQNISRARIDSSVQTLFFDCHPENIKLYESWDQPNFKMMPYKVTPDNVVDLIKDNANGGDFKFFDIDIDGYDYFVLREVLKSLSPALIIAELNEKIPPPIEFTVKYSPDYAWNGSHFFGMSISMFYKLMQEFEYDLVRLNFNNAYAIRKDTCHGFPSLSDVEAYDIGYRNPRLSGNAPQFKYNKDVDCLLSMSKEEGIAFLNDYYSESEGRYEIR